MSFLFTGIILPVVCSSQVSDTEIVLLHQLDSVQKSPSVASHFAGIYFEVTVKAVEFYKKNDAPAREFIQRLESSFAVYFFRSAEAFAKGAVIPAVWQTYFTGMSFTPLQYQLLGINAHINGDIWQAMTKEFSLQELKDYKRYYFDFNRALIKEYEQVYRAGVTASNTINILHHASLGLDKEYGKMMLKRWRKRQMQLAILYFTDHEKFSKKLMILHQKMQHLNRMITTYL